MPLTTRVWSAGKLLLLGGALLGTYVIFAMATMRIALRSREVQVPNLVNRSTAVKLPSGARGPVRPRRVAPPSAIPTGQ
jgi:hypothetical protein